MTSTNQSAESQPVSIALDFDLHHAPEKVWRALTEPELLAQWLLPIVDSKLEPGAKFMLKAPPQPGWDGIVHCRYLEIETHRKLSYTWVVDDIDTVVTFTLTPMPSGTRLSLVQSGFKPEQKQYIAGGRYGLEMVGGQLVELLERIA